MGVRGEGRNRFGAIKMRNFYYREGSAGKYIKSIGTTDKIQLPYGFAICDDCFKKIRLSHNNVELNDVEKAEHLSVVKIECFYCRQKEQ